ncbi:MAG: 3-deoxy-D-manno-octulosonic-acid transferase [Verrucomicrobia bacterium]|nr:MAG: 3-deoxy-D-manno-octulosonic-acid transferase [Verrucomicrobiota bacterium]
MFSAPDEQSDLRRSLRLYRLAAPFVIGLLAPGFLRRLLKRGGYREHFNQRFGLFTNQERVFLSSHLWTWIRSISVGETLVAIKLAKALRAADPEIRIAISITTSTGYALAAKEACDWLFVFYNPVDTCSAVRRVLNIFRPTRLILIEGEIWPNLMNACLQANIPVMLANARLSPRSARRFAKFKRWTSPFFKLLKWVAIPDEEDRCRWESLGVPQERIHLTGSIKFDQAGVETNRQAEFSTLLQKSGVEKKGPLLVAGSTHDGEEEILLDCFHLWHKKYPALRMLIAPRHVERIPAILKNLQSSNTAIILRSALPLSTPWDVAILDTTGELRDWYFFATVAFVGKSLTAKGGQNPVEPALAGKPVVFGPHMENFQSVATLLLEGGGALQATSGAHLTEIVDALLSDSDARQRMGTNAKSLLLKHHGSAKRTAELVLETA